MDSAKVVISSKMVTPSVPSGESRLAPVAARCHGVALVPAVVPALISREELLPADAMSDMVSRQSHGVGSSHETRGMPWIL